MIIALSDKDPCNAIAPMAGSLITAGLSASPGFIPPAKYFLGTDVAPDPTLVGSGSLI